MHRIDTVTASLQAVAMKTRMQPIDQVFSKFPRIVRDLAVTCGKEVTLEVDGADTELDRSLIETIRDPLTHLVRSAVDHGVEPPEVRVARGKPAAGKLSLRAYHESGQVTVEIRDDGGGIPVEAVRNKAVARGLLTPEQAALLPDERVLQFIFEPGFSTAAKVTDVSGRGVGMDVVRTNIEAIGGSVDVASRPGLGTTVRVRIPLTLAIIPALIVSCGSHRFAIPQAAVRELIALRAGATASAVTVDSDFEVARHLPEELRDRYFVRLQGKWSIGHDCRKYVEFRQMNLLDPWQGLPPCDIAFLRNVLIYFDVPTRAAILGKMRVTVRPDGALFLGGAETMLGVCDTYERVEGAGCSYYRPRRGPAVPRR